MKPTILLTAALSLSTLAAGVQALTLGDALRAAVAHHPAVRAAALEVDAANVDVDAARRQQWPTVSAVAESASSDAVPTRVMRIEQTLWDFGRTQAGVDAAQAGVAVAQAARTLQGQALGLQVIDAWQKLLAARGRARSANAMLLRLHEHEAMMERRVKAEVSTQVDLDLVGARILQGRAELAQAQAAERLAVTRLKDLTGLALTATDLPPWPEPLRLQPAEAAADGLAGGDWDAVVNRQPSVLKALEAAHQAQQHIKAKSAESYPQLYARLEQSLRDRTHAVFVGVRYSPGAGFSTWAETQALSMRSAALEQSAEAARVDMRQAVAADLSELSDSRQRAASSQAAVASSQRVLESYERQFPSGRKSWIDLMNAVREVAQNEYALVDAYAAMQGAMHRLQLRADPERVGAPALPATAN